MEGTPLLTSTEFQSLLLLADQRGYGNEENSLIYDAIDQLLAVAWKRCIGVERYMLLRLTGMRGIPYVVQALRFEGWCSDTSPSISIAGPKLTPSGGLGRKVYSKQLFGRTNIERRKVDGTWCSLGVVLPGVLT